MRFCARGALNQVFICPFGVLTWGRMSLSNTQSRAVWMLLLATSFWGTTFLLMKALGQCQQQLVPQGSTWFFSSLSLLVRFGGGAAILLLWNWRQFSQFTRLEWALGGGLGLFGGIGLIFQMDGVQHAPASTSAFLTQCYCILIPAWMAVRRRQLPAKAVVASCILVLVGVALLANVNWSDLCLGRGEAETILGSILFTGQILWLERPVFAKAKTGPTTLIMFMVVAAVVLPVVLLTTVRPRDLFLAYSTGPTVGIILWLTVACTVIAFILMNRWQSQISSTHASLIYCAEPLFTSVFALFLPAFLSLAIHIDYPNEALTPHLLVGGGLITVANVLMFWHGSRTQRPRVPERVVPPKKSQKALPV